MKSTAANGKDFQALARGNPRLWSQATGCKVTHTRFGDGVFVGLVNSGTLVRVKLDAEKIPRDFHQYNDDFGKITFLLPDELEQSIHDSLEALAIMRKKRDEKWAKQHAVNREIEQSKDEAYLSFAPLLSKYKAPRSLLFDGDQLSPLASILQKIESGERIDDWELEWLDSQDQQRLLALAYYRHYKHENDGWALVKACKHLRKAELPEKALEISAPESLNTNDPRLHSALLTTRGGAYRDLHNLASAKASATEAIDASPRSYHPHNLLGAVLYEEGNPAAGDEAFERANALGSSPRNQDFEIRHALERSTGDARTAVVAYLLNKDPERYAWVSKFAG